MRMRKKKHSAERIDACAGLLVKDPLSFGGNAAAVFAEKKPLYLEIGCGKGDFAVGLSRKFPDVNIIALERVPDVAMFALEKAKAALDEGSRPDNLRFIIGNAEYLYDWFAPSTFDRIHINFCDPWPQKGYHKRRLTAPAFLDMYARLLVPGGELHFKTDNEDLFDWSVETFRTYGLGELFYTRDLHNSDKKDDNIVTEYEKHFSDMGMNIYSAHERFPNPKKPQTVLTRPGSRTPKTEMPPLSEPEEPAEKPDTP